MTSNVGCQFIAGPATPATDAAYEQMKRPGDRGAARRRSGPSSSTGSTRSSSSTRSSETRPGAHRRPAGGRPVAAPGRARPDAGADAGGARAHRARGQRPAVRGAAAQAGRPAAGREPARAGPARGPLRARDAASPIDADPVSGTLVFSSGDESVVTEASERRDVRAGAQPVGAGLRPGSWTCPRPTHRHGTGSASTDSVAGARRGVGGHGGASVRAAAGLLPRLHRAAWSNSVTARAKASRASWSGSATRSRPRPNGASRSRASWSAP